MQADAPDIDSMSPREFEYFIADLWRRQGYDAYPTQQSGDGGADVIADDGTERLAIEAKWRSHGKVGPDYVRKISGVANKQGFDRGVLVTNRDFSNAAYREANQMGVKLYNGPQVRDIDASNSSRQQKSGLIDEKFRWNSESEHPFESLRLIVIGLIILTAPIVRATTWIIEEPERAVDILWLLLAAFVGYIFIDAFLGVVGYNLPGGV